ncbi:MAG: response regulator [Planctomycetota bacterium]
MSERNSTVLIVDDESHITHVVALKLQNAGFETVTAGDGEEGLELAVQHGPDLVITDLQMPYMSGIELAKAMYAREDLCDVPVLMLTARGYALEQGDLDDTHIESVLSKPFSPRQVLAVVEELLEKSARKATAQRSNEAA